MNELLVSNDHAMQEPEGLGIVPFGREMREQFLLDESYHNLNHGSFGTYPRHVRDSLHHYQDLTERKPDLFIRYDNPILLDRARAAIARLINASTDNVVFVPNATIGINTVLRNLVDHFDQGDSILYFDTTYGACGNTIQSICDSCAHVSAIKISVTYPLSDEDLLQAFRNAVYDAQNAGQRVRVALFDTISSIPGVRVPFEALTVACKDLGIFSLIDGAHGVGQIPLDLTTLDPDFFVSNAHKWLYTPRGCCIFYVALRNQHLLRTTVPTSHGFIPKSGTVGHSPLPPSKKSAFVNNFEFVGTMDPAPYLCIPAALCFRTEACGGHSKIMAYMADLAKRGGQLVAKRLGTCVLDNENSTLTRGIAMVNVRLPLRLIPSNEVEAAIAKTLTLPDLSETPHDHSQHTSSTSDAGPFVVHLDPETSPQAFVHSLSDKIVKQHATFVQLYWYSSAIWARLSAQIYLHLADFEYVAEVLWTVSSDLGAASQSLTERT